MDLDDFEQMLTSLPKEMDAHEAAALAKLVVDTFADEPEIAAKLVAELNHDFPDFLWTVVRSHDLAVSVQCRAA